MTGPTRRVRHATAGALLTLGLTGALAACGQGSDEAAAPAPTATDTATASTVQVTRYLPGAQPDPVPDHVSIDGTSDTLTQVVLDGTEDHPERAFTASSNGRGITVASDSTGATRAFQKLCIGQLDIVDSSTPISPEEWQQCRADGLDIVQFQVAADAVVVAIKSETDVGTDCLSTDELKTSFGRGSTVKNWNQIDPDFDDVPFHAGGPTVATSVASFFGSYIFDDPDPISTDFRSDYATQTNEEGTLDLVAGSEKDQKVDQRYTQVGPLYRKLVSELRAQRKYYRDAHQQRLDARAEQLKGERTGRPARAKHHDDQVVSDAYANEGEAITKVNAAKVKVRKVRPRYLLAKAADDRVLAARGTAGIFSEGFYATYENMLRPFEIEVSDDGDTRQNCIFPSPQTILNGQYPLSRQLLLTVSTRSLQRPEVRDLLSFYLKNSQATAVSSGLVPLPDSQIATELGWLDDGPLPTYASVDGGPVELQTTPTTATTTVANPMPAHTDDKPAR